jgi:hypothetical protein
LNISFLLVEGLSGWASAARAEEEGVERPGSSGRELEEGVESRAVEEEVESWKRVWSRGSRVEGFGRRRSRETRVEGRGLDEERGVEWRGSFRRWTLVSGRSTPLGFKKPGVW